jgi:two-component system sensor histidine kinase VicK
MALLAFPRLGRLTTKVTLYGFLMVLVAIVVVTAVILISERDKLNQDITDNAHSYATFAAPVIYRLYLDNFTHNRAELIRLMNSQVEAIAQRNHNLVGLQLIGVNGKLLYLHGATPFLPQDLGQGDFLQDQALLQQIGSESDSSRTLSLPDRQSGFEVIIPIPERSGGHIVSARFLFSLTEINQRFRDIILQLLMVLAPLLTVTLFFVFRFSASLTNPLIQLTEATQKISQGDLSVRAKVNSQDELGTLSQSFNSMAQALGQGIDTIKKERNKLSAILESIGDGVFVLDTNKNIILANQVTQTLSGFTAAELIDHPYNQHLKFVLEDSGQENTSFIDAVYHSGTAAEMTNHTLLVKKDGSKIFVADSAAPLKTQTGQVYGCVVVFRDVSQEREVERMKDEFISISSHQLRTPLTALRWKSQRLSREKTGPLNQKQLTLVKEMNQSIIRLEALLNINHLDTGKLVVEPQPINLVDLITSTTNELQDAFAAKKQTLKLTTDVPQLIATLDPNLIRQVLLNLLTNANKYSPPQTQTTVSLSHTDTQLTLTVSDQGYGIPARQLDKVFERFFRADNIVKTDTEGTGLGLYLVKKIVEASGGTITFQSQENHGTTFWITLPLTGLKAKPGDVSLV